MSSHNYGAECPKCGAEMTCSSSNRPYDMVSGECLECGFCYFTKEAKMPLKEVNEIREEFDRKPLKKLKKWRTK